MVALISYSRMLKNTPASNLNFRWWWYAILLGKRVLNLNFSQSLIVATIHSKQLFPWKHVKTEIVKIVERFSISGVLVVL